MKIFWVLFFLSLSSLAQETVSVDFEWELIPGSSQYEVQILDQKKKLLQKLTSPTAVFKTELPPGNYFIKGRVLDRRKAFSDWSSLSDFTILPPQPKLKEAPLPLLKTNPQTFQAELNLDWEETRGTAEYQILIKNEKGQEIQKLTTKTPGSKVLLKPGKYTYEVVSISKDGIRSEPLKSQNLIEVPAVELLKVKSVRMENRKILLEKSLSLPTGILIFYRPYYGEWKQVAQESTESESYELSKDLKPGEYKVIARHLSPLGESSEPFELSFIIKPEDLL